jgi:hypothetical protein
VIRRVAEVHAFVVGIGWFVVGLPLAIWFSTHEHGGDAIIHAVPDVMLGGTVVVVAVVAFPFLWPLWLALGMAEVSALGRSRNGEPGPARSLARLIGMQAAGWMLLSLVVGAAGNLTFGNWSDHPPMARGAFLAPAAVALTHGLLAMRLRPSPGERLPGRP